MLQIGTTTVIIPANLSQIIDNYSNLITAATQHMDGAVCSKLHVKFSVIGVDDTVGSGM